MNYSIIQKASLDDIIVETAMRSNFVRNPGVDFTRSRKLNFTSTFRGILEFGGNSLNYELRKHFKSTKSRPTVSAFVQAREKILPAAFEHVFRRYTDRLKTSKKFKGYRLIGFDGTRLPISLNYHDKETLLERENHKGNNSLHISTSYDLLNRIFIDAIIQPFKQMNEPGAIVDMIRSYPEDSIVIADRGLESYNIFAQLSENNLKYLIRGKDVVKKGITGALNLPDSEFDKNVTVHLSRSNTKKNQSLENFKLLIKNSRFDLITEYKQVYELSFRVVRIKLENENYVTLITNLDKEFTVEDIKDLYSLRWKHETAFSELKYSVGLMNLHAKKKDSVFQEIFARLILYNFCKSIVENTTSVFQGKTYKRQVNFKMAVVICREFLLELNTVLIDLEAEFYQYTLPIRDQRSFERKLTPKGFSSFNYRIA